MFLHSIRSQHHILNAMACLFAALAFLPEATAADALRFIQPQSWAAGDQQSTYQEWDRFTAVTNNLPDVGSAVDPASVDKSRLSALPPALLASSGNFYAFSGDYSFRAEVFNNGGASDPAWGTHVIVQIAATLGSGDAVMADTLTLVKVDGTPLPGGEPQSRLRHDVIYLATTAGGPAGPVTQREEIWEFFLPGFGGDFVVQAQLKMHASLRQVRIDTLRTAGAEPLIRIPILHPESAFGDFSGDGGAPTDLGMFGAGLHHITAHYGDDGSNNDDADIVTFCIPEGYELVGLDVASYAVGGNNGQGSFFAIADGKAIGTTIPTATNHLGNALISKTGDLLGPLANAAYFGNTRVSRGQALPAGDYTVFLNEITGNIDLSLAVTVARQPLEFQLLTWNDEKATPDLPSAVGRKPSPPMPTVGDWLVFTGDDAVLAAGNNSLGAISHNLVDITGAGGPGYNLAPSLSGKLSLRLEPVSGQHWRVTATSLTYSGQANAAQTMNQLLVGPGSPASTNATYGVDGLTNPGQWTADPSGLWAIRYALDFYLATSADGDPDAADVDATFNDKEQVGLLIPVHLLTSNGLAALSLDDPLGFHAGDFEAYLVEHIKPRLPVDATYLLVTQMAKTHPGYAEPGLPITTGSLIGNTTVAYTTQALSGPPRILSLQATNGLAVLSFTAAAGGAYAIQRSAHLAEWETIAQPQLSYPSTGVATWTDAEAGGEGRFYRVLSLTP
jgi:hypothetical protein